MQNPILLIGKFFFRFMNHIFSRDNIIVSNIFPFLAISSIIFYQYTELEFSTLTKEVNKIYSDALTIDPYSIILSNYSFVYFVSNNVNYPILSDNEFGIQTNAAILKRSIDYCQWLEEGFDSVDKVTRTRRYMKVWVKENIDSSEFMDLRYYNPSHKLTLLDRYTFADSILIGFYIINSSIFKTNRNDFTPFELDYNRSTLLPNFNHSFQYIGNGQFYYYYNASYHNLSLPHKKNDDCTPGDIRVSFYQYSPEKISVAGQFNSSTHIINTKISNKFQIGALAAGNVSLKNLLIIRYKKIFTITKIVRFLMWLGVFFFIIMSSMNQIDAIQKFIIASFITLSFKLLIWKAKYFIYSCLMLTFVIPLFFCLLF